MTHKIALKPIPPGKAGPQKSRRDWIVPAFLYAGELTIAEDPKMAMRYINRSLANKAKTVAGLK